MLPLYLQRQDKEIEDRERENADIAEKHERKREATQQLQEHIRSEIQRVVGETKVMKEKVSSQTIPHDDNLCSVQY